MKIERIETFLIRLPLKSPYETSGSRETHQTRVIARVETGGVVGWGESVAPETPWYSGETPETVWWLLDAIAIPRILAADLSGPDDTSRVLGWIKDHRMAKATLEMAIWDVFAKIAMELEGGYQRVKVKIKPGWDLQIAEAIRKRFPELAFQLDANSAYTLEAIPLFKRIDATAPLLVEQPLAEDDIIDHATLQKAI